MRKLDRLWSSLVAISLAFLVWLYARSRDQEVLDNVAVPVHISLPASQASNFALEVSGPAQVLASFTGPPARLRELRAMLQRGELDVDVTLIVPEENQGESIVLDTVVVDSTDLHVPHGINATVLDGRNKVPVTLHRLIEKQLPVRFDPSLEDHYFHVTAKPVLVRGPQEVLEHTRSIATVPYSISSHAPRDDQGAPHGTDGMGSSFTVGPVAVVQELEGKRVQTIPAEVMLNVNAQPVQQVHDIEVPVHFLCPEDFPFCPSFVQDSVGRLKLRVSGPAARRTPRVSAYIDLTGRHFEPGIIHEQIQLQLPAEFQLAQAPPAAVEIKLAPHEVSP